MTTANHDQLGSRCKAHIDQATRTALSRPSSRLPMLSCCRFRGHEDKIVTKELEIGHGKTEVHEGVQV